MRLITDNSLVILIKISFILQTSAVQFPDSLICIFDIIFTDPVKLKVMIWE